MIEQERTFLAKHLPDLRACPCEEIIDIFIPADSRHPCLRIRKKGGQMEITKKQPIDGDPSKMREDTIPLTEKEFSVLSQVHGRKTHKKRYRYDSEGHSAEIDVFEGPLAGLVLVDFEFENTEEKQRFTMPDFCLAEVTHEEFVAGEYICGKCYQDIEEKLDSYGYRKIQQ
ncbi:MAG: hypothetical protein ACOCWQ_03055 [Nanoarchaeota archaeon]